jgi:O-antigen/teichoic acid export membrane protein
MMPVEAPSERSPAVPPPGVDVPRRGHSLGVNLSALLTSQAITWGVTAVWTVIVPRAIGPSQMGLLTIGLSSAAIFAIVLGIPTREYVTREMVADRDREALLLGSALALRCFCTPVFLLLIALYAYAADLTPAGTSVIYMCTLATLCYSLTEPALSAFQASERMEFIAYSEVLNRTLQSLGGIVLALLGLGVVAISGFAAGVSVLVCALSLRWATSLVKLDLRISVAGLWALARGSAPYWITSVFFMLYLWIDAVMLGLLVPSHVVGWYGVATKLFTTLMFLPVLLATAWLPRLVRAFVDGGYPGLTLAARVPVETVIVVSLPVSVAAAMSADVGIRLLYGEAFGGAGVVLAVLALSVPAMYLSIMLNQVLIAAGRPGTWAWVLGAATLLNVTLNWVLIPVYQERYQNGAVGAALALLLTEIAVVSAGMLLVGRRVLPRAAFWRLSRACVAAGLMAAEVYLLAPTLGVLAALVGVVAFGGSAAVLRVVAPEERAALAAIAARLWGAASGSAPIPSRLRRGPSAEEPETAIALHVPPARRAADAPENRTTS